MALLTGMTATPGVAQGVGQDAVRAGAASQPEAAGSPRTKRHLVTLITGDRVTVETGPAGRQSVSVEPAKGREHITFVKRQSGGDWTVIPVDALPLLAADRLDRALFNVSALVKEKYANRPSLPLIVQYTGETGAAERRLADAGAEAVAAIAGTSFATLNEHREDAAKFWENIAPAKAGTTTMSAGVHRVWLDGRAKVSLDKTVPRIGVPQAWAKGFRGEGVKVAVLDSGHDPDHPDLKGLIADSANFTDEPDADDLLGHGTHVTSTVAGSGAASGGTYKGVAPGVQILSGKVCTATGECANSDIIEGMAWAVQNGAKVINLSLGDVDTPETDALEAMVDTVTRDHGALVVAAAGNSGLDGTISSPASADRALAVGAAEVDDHRAYFSSVGPRVGDFGLKPDLVAPGVSVVAAKAGGTTAEDGYVAMSGTSMAAPHVTGAAAILFQQHPDWTPDQVKRQLMQSTAGGKETGAYHQGAGLVDVARAIDQQVTAESTGVDFGQIGWSGGTRPPVSKTITYRNPGDKPVTLHLKHIANRYQAQTSAYAPAPEGLFRLSADTVTVPARGTANVNLTVTPEATTLYAAYSGVVTAVTTDGRVSVRVPFGADIEKPSHDLRITMKNRSGAAPDYAYLLVNSADGKLYELELRGQGSTVLRLPSDTFSVSGLFFDAAFTEGIVVGAPKVVTTADRQITLDARAAKPVTVSAPSRSARIMSVEVGTLSLADELLGVTMPNAVGGDRIEGLYATPTAQSKDSEFTYVVSSVWGEPAGPDGNPSSVYHLTRPVRGAIPANPGYHPRKSELAQVNTTFAATAPNVDSYRYVWTWVDDFQWSGMEMAGIPTPTRRVDYFSTGDGLRWRAGFDQFNFMDPQSDRGQSYLSTLREYKSGAKVEERWNGGIQAVGFQPNQMNVSREGDSMVHVIQSAANGHLDEWAETTAGEARVELRRNGKLISQYRADSEVPADAVPADYRLTFEQDRELAPDAFISTSLRAEWRFRSKTTATRQALPLIAVRMSPELDEWNRAKSGREFDIPVLIQRPLGATQVPVRTFTTEVSYDEGKTWHKAEVKGSGTKRTVTVDHPRRSSAGSVSLRTYVKDALGNSFKQTVIKAYLLK